MGQTAFVPLRFEKTFSGHSTFVLQTIKVSFFFVYFVRKTDSSSNHYHKADAEKHGN